MLINLEAYESLVSPSEIVRARRQDIGMSQAEVARALDIKSSNFIAVIESGKSQVPFERLLDFANVLKLPKGWFVEKVFRHRLPELASYVFDELVDEKVKDALEASSGKD